MTGSPAIPTFHSLRALAACALMASACGAPSSGGGAGQTQVASLAGASAAGGTPIFVFMNGWGSCGGFPKRFGGAAYQYADQMRAALEAKTGARVPYVYSCYTSADNLFVTSSSQPATRRLGEADDLAAVIQAEMGGSPRPVFLVGHSYGGWTVMNTVLKLAPSVTIQGLVTSDPISRVDCRPNLMAKAIVSVGQDAPAPECTRAPTDLDAAKIKARAPVWHNFYQLEWRKLHAGVIAQADANTQLDMKHLPLMPSQAHARMAKDERMWADVKALLLSRP